MLNSDLIPVQEFDSGIAVISDYRLRKAKKLRDEKKASQPEEKPEPRQLTKQERFERLALLSNEFIERTRPPKLVFVPPPKPVRAIEPMLDFSAIPNEWKPPMLEEIARRVCSIHKITIEELKSVRRFRRIADARFHFYYLARKHTSKSFPEIARHVNKDHTTVLHGCNEFERRRQNKRKGKIDEK